MSARHGPSESSRELGTLEMSRSAKKYRSVAQRAPADLLRSTGVPLDSPPASPSCDTSEQGYARSALSVSDQGHWKCGAHCNGNPMGAQMITTIAQVQELIDDARSGNEAFQASLGCCCDPRSSGDCRPTGDLHTETATSASCVAPANHQQHALGPAIAIDRASPASTIQRSPTPTLFGRADGTAPPAKRHQPARLSTSPPMSEQFGKPRRLRLGTDRLSVA